MLLETTLNQYIFATMSGELPALDVSINELHIVDISHV